MGDFRGPIFIVGPSRSGTAMCRTILSRHPLILVAGETHYFDDLRVRLGGFERSPLADADRRRAEDYFLALDHRPYGHEGDPEQSSMARPDLATLAQERGGGVDAYFEAYCTLTASREGKTIWGDKTPRHVFRIAEMVEAYPEAKVLCMVRDPRAVVASYRDWRNQGGFDLERDPTHADALAREEARVRRTYNPLLLSLLWRSTVRATLDAADRFGRERVRVQKYESIVRDSTSEIESLCDWLGVDFDQAMLDVPMLNSSFSRFAEGRGVSAEAMERWRERLSPAEIAVVQSCCRRDMERLDYAPEPVRSGALPVVRAWATLPRAVARAALANRERMGSMPKYIVRRCRLAFG